MRLSSAPALNDFIELANKVRDLLREERRKVDVGGYESQGSLAKIKSDVSRLIVIGDLHGDYECLKTILSNIDLDEAFLVFLGDYIDRGDRSPQVVYEVLSLKLKKPSSILLLMGNHEGPPELPVYPHDFPLHLALLYGSSWRRVYESIMDCFSYFYACSVLEGSIFMVHGGVPTRSVTLGSLANAHQDIELLEELLWNDPMPGEGVDMSPRGAGFLFGSNITRSFLESTGVRVVIRAHEPCEEGYEVHHDGMLMTIFSRKGPPYFNTHAAYLDIRNPGSVKSAYQLAKDCIRLL